MALNAVKKFFESRINASGQRIGLSGDISSINKDGVVDVQADAGDINLASAKILVGNASGLAAAVDMGGDATIDNAGAVTIGADKVTYAKMQNVEIESVIANPTTGAVNPQGVAIGESQVLARAVGGHVAGQKVVPLMTDNIPIGLNFGVPAANVDDRYVALVAMKATAYTLANASPGDSLCRNVSVTHATVDTTDTFTIIHIEGTNYNDAAITEDITIIADNVAVGAKAFKTITQAITSGWVMGGGTADNIKVGFIGLVGLPVVLSAAADLVMATHGTGVLNAPTVAVGATIETCTIDLTTTGDGAKRLRLFYQN
jgi:hypothetical protein